MTVRNIELTGFHWDTGNLNKNRIKHKVENKECEELFFNKPLIVITSDPVKSKSEKRYYAFGKTNVNRLLFIVFTIRNKQIRVISARNMSKKEAAFYEEQSKKQNT